MTREKSGWIREWRQATDEDMYWLDPHTFKLWHYLLIHARHTKYHGLEPGDLITTYQEIREGLRMRNGKTFSQHTIQEGLLILNNLGYIKILSANRGIGLHIHITRWEEMQEPRSTENAEFIRIVEPEGRDLLQQQQ